MDQHVCDGACLQVTGEQLQLPGHDQRSCVKRLTVLRGCLQEDLVALLPGCTVERAALMPTMARLQNGQRAELVAENEAADALRDWANDCDVDDLQQLQHAP